MFQNSTYIVVDLPKPISEEICKIRTRFDLYTAGLPSEITITGSSGVGLLVEDQDPDLVFRAIDRVAKDRLPFDSALDSVERFAGTSIVWFKPRDRAPFDDLQKALVSTGIRFRDNPFPFNPHCTICSSVVVDAAMERDLAGLAVPCEPFTLATLSVYQLINKRAVLLRSFPSSA